MKKILFAAAICWLALSTPMSAQSSYSSNNPLANNPLGYLGWNDNQNTFLSVRQNNLLRMEFRNQGTWTGLNGFTAFNVQRTFMPLNGVSGNPASMLHLGQPTNNNAARNWMNIGVTFTNNTGNENGDHMYVGLMQRANGTPEGTDAIINWGCNDNQNGLPSDGPDNLRFIFTTISGGPGQGGLPQGRETMRIAPEGNVGIGNFSPDGLNQQPSERLDVQGNARFRHITDNVDHVLITGTQNGPSDYTLSRIDFGNAADQYLANNGTWQSIQANAPCDWNLSGTDDLATGYPGACRTDAVVIGQPTPQADTKLTVFRTAPGSSMNTGVDVRVSNGAVNTAGYFTAQGGTFNYGVRSSANSGASNNYGVYAKASAAGAANYGVLASAGGGTTNWAGYFNGNVNVIGNMYQNTTTLIFSDEVVKSNVNELQPALDKLLSLKPKSYNYNQEAFPDLNFSSQTSFGFIAQEIQEVIPEIVGEVLIPVQYDEDGNQISQEHKLLGIRYDEIIPILV